MQDQATKKDAAKPTGAGANGGGAGGPGGAASSGASGGAGVNGGTGGAGAGNGGASGATAKAGNAGGSGNGGASGNTAVPKGDEGAKAAAKAEAAAQQADAVVAKAAQGDFVRRIIDKIKSSENIVIALSKHPTLDGIAAAIALALFLDGMQRHVTAVFSGEVPSALGFLQPDAVFERDTASLQDFIISLDKDKADHLRYKLEGDFVKVYITPYKTEIKQEDLTFEKGDYNVDFLITMDVKSAGDLDEALGAEYGQIMHDTATVNITTEEPGRFGEIEWSNQSASSLCEMTAELIFGVQGQKDKLDREVATALLTGIVTATERFSNGKTNAETLNLASKLMSLGADQQTISANVMRPMEAAQAQLEQQRQQEMTDEERAAQAREEERIRAQKEAEEAIARGLPPASATTAAEATIGAPAITASESAGDAFAALTPSAEALAAGEAVNAGLAPSPALAAPLEAVPTAPAIDMAGLGAAPVTAEAAAEPAMPTMVNPAAAIAGEMAMPSGPAPAELTIPAMDATGVIAVAPAADAGLGTPGPVAPVDVGLGTPGPVAPVDAGLGTPGSVATGDGVAAAAATLSSMLEGVAPAPTEAAGGPMVTEEQKDYASMLAAALEEPTPTMPQGGMTPEEMMVSTGAAGGMMDAGMPEPGAVVALETAAAPADPGMFNLPTMPSMDAGAASVAEASAEAAVPAMGSFAPAAPGVADMAGGALFTPQPQEPVMTFEETTAGMPADMVAPEPIAKPEGMVLPPAPEPPVMDGMMPPSV